MYIYTSAQKNSYTLFQNIEETLKMWKYTLKRKENNFFIVSSDYIFKMESLISTCIYFNIKSEIPVNP